MITTYYTPTHNLPTISLTIRDGKLLVLDWYCDKTVKLLDRLNHQSCVIPVHKLQNSDQNQAAAIQVCQQLDEYFQGRRQRFSIPLDVSHGTPFQRQVWQALCNINYGETISYKALAERIGKPKSFRAVANANGKNLISLIIPCHRVIASDGGLGGYTGGIDIKTKLLELEQSAS
ncbi:methylated-DNA--[protein]-cysteine S-methyltransferase [Moraxella nasovis]|uniref:methylated-DNA--[protein]-cysteine S-methyltransferase n=1 Tax=Moraxella nasovis TaxID=2904121 RepID=UPI001F60DC1C|nr:methylated-DNA--[protein]-cysteine S-methyltransferase [Moraxella nasovis]UNU73591.1 methylated-DNA--[protein]-cysteine S-methyltransferase [Moraxella nasovis]